MPAEARLTASPVEVLIPFLNRRAIVLRRAQGLVVAPNQVEVFRLLDDDSLVEDWAFPPGSRVACISEFRGGRQLLVARHRIA
jgi:hypothetical protein